MDEKFLQFLQSRNVPVGVIEKLIEDKVDTSVIHLLTDEELKSYFPIIGDRIAIKNYCKNNSNSSKKNALIDILKKKMKRNTKKKHYTVSCSSNSSNSDPEEKKKKKSNPERQIEIGWFCGDAESMKQVRSKGGGGTRKIKVPGSFKKESILQRGIELFFPKGKSNKGSRTEFEFELWDFKGNRITDDVTVSELYNLTGLTRLRFYLASMKKSTTNTSTVTTSCTSEGSRHNLNEIIESSTESAVENENVLEEFFVFNETQDGSTVTTGLKDQLYTYECNNLWTDYENVTTMMTLNHQEILPNAANVHNLKLHRGQVLNELIEVFLKIDSPFPIIEVEIYDTQGNREPAYDAGGVFKDVLSEFWSEFYERYCDGTLEKIPLIRHDFDQRKWQSVAKILYVGYLQVKYFPSRIARVFIEEVMFGKFESNLVDSYLNHIAECDGIIIKEALQNYGNVDEEELLEILSNYDCKKKPNKDNFRNIITEIAHTKLIQRSMFIIDAWNTILEKKLSSSELQLIYINKKVTNKAVIKMLICEPKNSTQIEVFEYLKKYLRELNLDFLEKFLRFCTGANMITDNEITVSFNENSGFSRRPESKTCGNLLLLPEKYDTFLEFKSEFNCILSSNEWRMDSV